MSFETSDLFIKVNELAQIMRDNPKTIETEYYASAQKLFKVHEEVELFAQRKILKIRKKELLSEIILDISQGCPLLRNYRWIIKMHQNFYRIEKQSLDEPVSTGAVFSIELAKVLSPIAKLKSTDEEEITQDEFNSMIYYSAVSLSQCLI